MIAINFRDITLDQYTGDGATNFLYFKEITKNLSQMGHFPIHLIPMHTFCIGGDDRYILNKIALQLNDDRIVVHNNPLCLQDTMNLFYHAKFCIGMRFHSIVLQSVLNGKNYILDYTDPKKGKIVGMLEQLHLKDNISNRYLSLHDTPLKTLDFNTDIERLHISDTFLEKWKAKYITLLKKLEN